MPVTTEILSKSIVPSDYQDLIKIYQDYPHYSGNQAQTFIEDLSNQLSQKSSKVQIIGAGRFNDKLIGAFVLEQSHQYTIDLIPTWELKKLCVRAITRRRGVAIDMLRGLLKIPPLYLHLHLQQNQHLEQRLHTNPDIHSNINPQESPVCRSSRISRSNDPVNTSLPFFFSLPDSLQSAANQLMQLGLQPSSSKTQWRSFD